MTITGPIDFTTSHRSTLTANIRKRRGRKVAINVPIFHDRLTPRPFVEQFPLPPFPEDGPEAALPDCIYMDAMCFGMGCSWYSVRCPPTQRIFTFDSERVYLPLASLQITFQLRDIDEARRLYDQLVPLSPIMLALTAAAPIFRGFLADVDCRWDVIANSVDDRTEEEMGLKVGGRG